MNLFDQSEIEYPSIVSIKRPVITVNEDGDSTAAYETMAEELTADIQFQRVPGGGGREMLARWRMYCDPGFRILPGDRVTSAERVFSIESVSEWGSHTECVMKEE